MTHSQAGAVFTANVSPGNRKKLIGCLTSGLEEPDTDKRLSKNLTESDVREFYREKWGYSDAEIMTVCALLGKTLSTRLRTCLPPELFKPVRRNRESILRTDSFFEERAVRGEGEVLPILRMVAGGYSSGVPNMYRVEGLPNGETADIGLMTRGSAQTWKIRRNNRGKFGGTYATAEEALAALQSEIDPPKSRLASMHWRE